MTIGRDTYISIVVSSHCLQYLLKYISHNILIIFQIFVRLFQLLFYIFMEVIFNYNFLMFNIILSNLYMVHFYKTHANTQLLYYFL